MVDNVVGDQDVLVVDRHVPLNGIALQIAEVTVSDPCAIHLVMETLTQDRIVGFSDPQVVDHQIAHYSRFFAADINLGHRAIAAHRQPLDHAVGTADVEGNVFAAPLSFANHFTAILQHQPPASVAGQHAADAQGFALGDKNGGVDVVAGKPGGYHHRVAFGKGLFERRDPVTMVIATDIHRGVVRCGPHPY